MPPMDIPPAGKMAVFSDPSGAVFLEVNGEGVGGIGELGAEVPAEVPPHWRVYFSVPDTDAATQHITEL
ncbi:MAG: hypothetical protein ACRDSE_23415, partial [Pseudonocardiaceae bacterium]